MAALLAALAGCFWWFIDVLLCFLVSCPVIVAVGAGLALVWKYFGPESKEDKELRELVKNYDSLTLRGRVAMLGSPVVVVLTALVWRVWEVLSSNNPLSAEHTDPHLSPQTASWEHCEDIVWPGEDQGSVYLSDIMPTWFAPFWVVSDYEMDIAIVSLRLTKLLFVSAFLLSLPCILIAIHFVSKTEKPLLKIFLWVIDVYRKCSGEDCIDHIHKIIYLEFTVEGYLRTMLKATLAVMEKAKEVEQLEQSMEQLQKNIADMNRWLHSERKLANSFDRKNRDIERKLLSERRRVQSIESRCLDLEKKLETERKTSANWERKYNELQKKLSAIEKRPVVVKQQMNVDDILCVICMERKRQYLLRPCNHYCVCNKCKSTLQNKCPLCRKLIRNYEKIFTN